MALLSAFRATFGQDEMEFVTRGLFETFQGPFADS